MRLLCIMLLAYGICEIVRQARELLSWLDTEAGELRRRRLHRSAINTNIRLWYQTGDQYYIDRAEYLRKEA